MKILLTILIFGVIPISLLAQGKHPFTLLAEDLDPASTRVLYIGLENHISIKAEGIDPSQIILTTNNGTVEGSKGKYILRPQKTGMASLFVIKNGTKKDTLGMVLMKVMRFPEPLPTVAGKNSGMLKKEEILKAGCLKAIHAGSVYKKPPEYTIVSFTLVGMSGGFLMSIDSKSDSLNAKQRAFIETLKAGDKILFENVCVIGKDSIPRVLGAASFKISE
jgi:hypothetical protein